MLGGMLLVTAGQPPSTHPAYQAEKLERAWLRVSENGKGYASAASPNGVPTLWRYPAEELRRETDPATGEEAQSGSPQSYDRRKAMARCPGIVAQALEDYGATAFLRPVRRADAQPGTLWAAFLADADGAGKPLADVTRDLAHACLLERDGWLWVDTGAVYDPASATAADVLTSRAMIRNLDADRVLNWTEDAAGRVSAAVVQTADASGPFLWIVDDVYAARARIGQDGKVTGMEPQIPHGYGACPVIRCRPFGVAFSSLLAEVQREVFNLDSWSRQELFDHCFTLLAIIGAEAGISKMVTVGSSFAMVLPNPGATVQRLAPTSAADMALKAKQAAIADFYRLARLSPGNPAAAAQESGVARKLRVQQQTASLGKLMACLLRAENLAVRLWANAVGIPFPGVASHPGKFDVADESESLDRAARLAALPGLPPIMLRAEYRQLAATLYTLTPDEASTLSDELDTMDTLGSSLIPPPPDGGT